MHSRELPAIQRVTEQFLLTPIYRSSVQLTTSMCTGDREHALQPVECMKEHFVFNPVPSHKHRCIEKYVKRGSTCISFKVLVSTEASPSDLCLVHSVGGVYACFDFSPAGEAFLTQLLHHQAV